MRRNPRKRVLEESSGREAFGQQGLQTSTWVSRQNCCLWWNIHYPCPILRCSVLMLKFVCNSEGKVHVTGGERKQWETLCACMASVPAAFRNSWVIMSKSLLFRATTSQNPIHKFLKYHYKNSLIFKFIYLYSFLPPLL